MFARTERLLLRPIWPEDASALHQAIADEEIIRNLARAPWPYTQAEASRFAAVEHSTMFPSFMLMLRTDGAPRLIGSCGLGDRQGAAELGYWISKPYWRQGFAVEAAKAVVSIARSLGHRKLVAGHFIDNPASGRVLRKVGFQPLGRMEQLYSAGRGREASAALFELSLSHDGKSGGDPGAFVAIGRMQPRMPYAKAA